MMKTKVDLLKPFIYFLTGGLSLVVIGLIYNLVLMIIAMASFGMMAVNTLFILLTSGLTIGFYKQRDY